MRQLSQELAQLAGGAVQQTKSDLFILGAGDTLTLPSFTIEYPDVGAPTNAYVLNGNNVHCSQNKEDNVWSVPSAISNSVCSKDSVTIQTDGTYLYVQATYSSPYVPA